MSLLEFANGNQETASKAALLGSIVQTLGWPALGQISGSGLVHQYDRIRPMVLILAGNDDNHSIVPLSEARQIVELLLNGSEFGTRFFDDVFLLIAPEPEPYLGPGGDISSPYPGTIGCGVNWSGGSGFMTAGHVAPTAGVGVFDGRTRLGTVLYASSPAKGGTAPMADMSVVELGRGHSFLSSFGKGVAGTPNSKVTVHNGRRAATGDIFAFCQFTYWKKIAGTYANTYITSTSVSIGGDSGSAVTDASNNVVGTLVGGSKANSFIQDIGYQIGQASSALPGLTA